MHRVFVFSGDQVRLLVHKGFRKPDVEVPSKDSPLGLAR